MVPDAPSPFVGIPNSDSFCANAFAFAIFDRFPVSPGHVLVAGVSNDQARTDSAAATGGPEPLWLKMLQTTSLTKSYKIVVLCGDKLNPAPYTAPLEGANPGSQPACCAKDDDHVKPIQKKAVVLLSGGLDSATCLAIAKSEGFKPYAITFRYGQRHSAEIEAARRTAAALNAREHIIVDIDLRLFGGSALTSDLAVPKGRPLDEMSDGIPITYVPARNTIFLSFALAWAEVLGAADIFIGVNALDYSGYPDCRPEYIAAYQAMANLATRESVEGRLTIKLHTPLINLTKAETIAKGLALGVNYAETSTCYDPGPGGEACGMCDACQLRLRGFQQNGLTDPAAYLERSRV